MTKRVITPQDRENAARLKRLWDQKKGELALTQEKATKSLGYRHQSTVSQYLNAGIALNTDAILAFARLLRVSPTDIDPSMPGLVTRSLRAPIKRIKVACRVIVSADGEQSMASEPSFADVPSPFSGNLPDGGEVFAVEVGSSVFLSAFNIPQWAVVYVLKDSAPQPGDIIFFRDHSGHAGFYRFSAHNQPDRTLVAYDPFEDDVVELNLDDAVEYGVKVGCLETALDHREIWSRESTYPQLVRQAG